MVIDTLNDLLEKWGHASRQPLVLSINELLGLMPQRGHAIIWVRQEFEPDPRNVSQTDADDHQRHGGL
jgi:hypothetical protein